MEKNSIEFNYTVLFYPCLPPPLECPPPDEPRDELLPPPLLPDEDELTRYDEVLE